MKHIKKYFKLVKKHFDKRSVKFNFVTAWGYFIGSLIVAVFVSTTNDTILGFITILSVSTVYTLGFLITDYKELLRLEAGFEDE